MRIAARRGGQRGRPGRFPDSSTSPGSGDAGRRARGEGHGDPYLETLTFARTGNATDGFITLRAFPGHTPILDGTGVPGDHMVLIASQSYVKLIGFEIRNHLQVNDGSGVRITGSGAHIEIRQNRIHDVRGVDAMGITVYGTSPTAPSVTSSSTETRSRIRAPQISISARALRRSTGATRPAGRDRASSTWIAARV